MASFSFSDLENLKRSGATVSDIHYRLSNTILNSDVLRTEVKTIDRNSGKYEIVVTGTISKPTLEHWKRNEK